MNRFTFFSFVDMVAFLIPDLEPLPFDVPLPG